MAIPFHLALLRSVLERLDVERLGYVVSMPAVQGAIRVTVHYYDGRACDSAATFIRRTGDTAALEMVYEKPLGVPLVRSLPAERYDVLARALAGLRFDHLPDQPDLPTYDSTDLWLIERAAGTFLHGVIVAPELAQGDYARLANAIRNGLPEALRQLH